MTFPRLRSTRGNNAFNVLGFPDPLQTKWAFVLEARAVTGQAATKAEAVAEAERAIERALAAKKLKLVRPERDR
jgi:hypothetical protein